MLIAVLSFSGWCRFLERARSLADRLPAWAAAASRAKVRPMAGAALLAVIAGGALAWAWPQARSAARQESGTQLDPPALASPVKIIGAAPRSSDCAEQVWPYIEHRCLSRAAANPRDQESAANTPDTERDRDGTVGAAPAGAAAAQLAARQPMPADKLAAEAAGQGEVATSYLALPGRAAALHARELPIPPGAVPAGRVWHRDRFAAAPQDEGAWDPRTSAPAFSSEPRHRKARVHRWRHGYTRRWFGFPF